MEGTEKKTPAKGDILDVNIVDFGVGGEGIGKHGDFVVFVQNTVPGDLARTQLYDVKKNYGFGNLVKIIEASSERIQPVCKHFGICGGCVFLHVNYDTELKFKKKKVNDAIKRIGGIDFHINEIIGPDEPYHYRNKAVYHVTADNDGGIAIGFYSTRTKRVCNVDGCKMFGEANGKIIAAFKEYMIESGVSPYDYRTKKGLVKALMVRESGKSGEILVCVIATSKTVPNVAGLSYHLTESVRDIPGVFVSGIVVNVSKSKNREVLGEETSFLFGEKFIYDEINGHKFKISAESFFQVNKKMTPALYETVKKYAALTNTETVLDVYCGIGTIALTLASLAKDVVGIELVAQAVNDAEENAKLNGAENVKFIAGDAGRVLETMYKDDFCADVAVLDPPRGGCSVYVLDGIRKLAPKRIVYVSCEPSTLARDMKALYEFGYKALDGICVDMFGRSGHVESVILMSRD